MKHQCELVDQLHSTYRAIEDWMAERRLRHVGPAYEYYLNDPQGTPSAELQTRIVLPVARRDRPPQASARHRVDGETRALRVARHDTSRTS